jgi:diguanylate cyclase (GGDEF)-like protein
MNWISVETLSLAAEVTFVLLLLAYALPQKKSELGSSSKEPSIDWEPLKFLYVQNWMHRGLYLTHLSERTLQSCSASPSNAYLPRANLHGDDDIHIAPAPWLDRLTKQLNRQGFDTVLREWMSVPIEDRKSACLALIAINNYAEITSAHHAMVTEQIIRQIALHVTDPTGQSVVSKYLPDRFACLRFAQDAHSYHTAMEKIQSLLAHAEFRQSSGESVSVTFSISVLSLAIALDEKQQIDVLEEGIQHAIEHHHRVVSLVDEQWTDTPTVPPVSPEASQVFSETTSQAAMDTVTVADDLAAIQASVQTATQTEPVPSAV